MIEDPNVDVAMDDIIHVTGTVKDAFEGENALGGVITAPMILADSIEKTDYQTAFAPAKQTIELNAEQNQHGYKLTVQKVELADQELACTSKSPMKPTTKFTFTHLTPNSSPTVNNWKKK